MEKVIFMVTLRQALEKLDDFAEHYNFIFYYLILLFYEFNKFF
jgi:hypothetical protein